MQWAGKRAKTGVNGILAPKFGQSSHKDEKTLM